MYFNIHILEFLGPLKNKDIDIDIALNTRLFKINTDA